MTREEIEALMDEADRQACSDLVADGQAKKYRREGFLSKELCLDDVLKAPWPLLKDIGGKASDDANPGADESSDESKDERGETNNPKYVSVPPAILPYYLRRNLANELSLYLLLQQRIRARKGGNVFQREDVAEALHYMYKRSPSRNTIRKLLRKGEDAGLWERLPHNRIRQRSIVYVSMKAGIYWHCERVVVHMSKLRGTVGDRRNQFRKWYAEKNKTYLHSQKLMAECCGVSRETYNRALFKAGAKPIHNEITVFEGTQEDCRRYIKAGKHYSLLPLFLRVLHEKKNLDRIVGKRRNWTDPLKVGTELRCYTRFRRVERWQGNGDSSAVSSRSIWCSRWQGARPLRSWRVSTNCM